MHCLLYLSSLLVIPFAFAQNSTVNSTIASLAAQIPACVQACGTAAIVKVGCSFTDYVCQCQDSTQLDQLILPCLQANSTCSAADITKFETTSIQICAALGINITAPTNLPTSGGGAASTAYTTGTGSASASNSASAAASTSSKAGAMATMDVNVLAKGSYVLVGAGLLGLFL